MDLKYYRIDVDTAGISTKIENLDNIWKEKTTSDLDSESVNLAHRFHWLLEEIARNASVSDIKRFYEIIITWSKSSYDHMNSIAFSPYNLSLIHI